MKARIQPEKLVLMAACALPVLAVVLVRFAAGGPSTASAGEGPEMGMTGMNDPMTQPASFSPDLTRAMAYARNLVGKPISNAVLNHEQVTDPVVQPEMQPIEPSVKEPTQAPQVYELPRLSLTAIIGSRRRTVAVINGELLKTGDEVAPGWRLAEIDGKSQEIRLMSLDGQTAWYSLLDND